LLRFLEENGEVTIEEAVLAASCLAALVGDSYLEGRRPSGTWRKRRLGGEAHTA
jgi:hypothetical protein